MTAFFNFLSFGLFTVQVATAEKKFVYQFADELDITHMANDQQDDSLVEGRVWKTCLLCWKSWVN